MLHTTIFKQNKQDFIESSTTRNVNNPTSEIHINKSTIVPKHQLGENVPRRDFLENGKIILEKWASGMPYEIQDTE